MTSSNRRFRIFILSILALVAVAAPAPLFAQGQNCPTGAPLTDPNVLQEMQAFNSGLSQRWPAAAAKIDPLTNLDEFTSTEKSCDTVGDAACGSAGGATCEHITFTAQLDQMMGLSGLSFSAPTQQIGNPKEIAQHTAKGPDASKITDGVYAATGHSATDPAYAIVLTHTPNNSGHALVVDLGSVLNVCGNGINCKSGPQIQADNDDVYQLDYSSDGSNWAKYGTFPTVSGSGLHTRGIATIKSGQNNPSFTARYLRVFAVSGGATFAVSELELWNTGSQLISVGKPAIGSRPYQITDGIFATPEGYTYNDPKYAAVLRSVGVAHALVIDLGAVTKVCGDSSCGPKVQADRHPFQIDFSPDGINWVPYSQVPKVSGSGLRTRTSSDIAANASAQLQSQGFTARYVRLYGLPDDDDNYTISEVELKDAAGTVLSKGKLTYGPEPLETDGQLAPEGTTFDNPDYATLLAPCGQSSSTVCAKGSRTGLTGPLLLDLGQAFSLEGIQVQADRHEFQIDYRASPTDAWQPLWTVQAVSASGLTTRPDPSEAPYQSLDAKQARYLMIYGTAGDDLNYSVSSVKVYTPIAKTPCAYASFADAAQQSASCTYDGNVVTEITTPAGGSELPISFTILNAKAQYLCHPSGGVSPDFHIDVPDGSIIGGTTCNANLGLEPSPQQFCLATCAAGAEPASVLTFSGISGNSTQVGPVFPLTDLACNHSTGNLTSGVEELAASTASAAVGQLFVGVAFSPVLGPSGQIEAPALVPTGQCPKPAPPPANTQLNGTATHVGEANEAGSVSLSGTVSAPGVPPLHTLTLTLDRVLHEQDGIEELVRTGGTGVAAVPLTLQPQEDSDASRAVYATAPGVRPGVSALVSKAPDGQLEFTLDVYDADVALPTCAADPSSSVLLGTGFSLSANGGPPIEVHALQDWRCENGNRLVTCSGTRGECEGQSSGGNNDGCSVQPGRQGSPLPVLVGALLALVCRGLRRQRPQRAMPASGRHS